MIDDVLRTRLRVAARRDHASKNFACYSPCPLRQPVITFEMILQVGARNGIDVPCGDAATYNTPSPTSLRLASSKTDTPSGLSGWWLCLRPETTGC